MKKAPKRIYDELQKLYDEAMVLAKKGNPPIIFPMNLKDCFNWPYIDEIWQIFIKGNTEERDWAIKRFASLGIQFEQIQQQNREVTAKS